jgi:hypothetical protein
MKGITCLLFNIVRVICGKVFYPIIDVAFVSMLILLTCVNEGIGACFVGALQFDNDTKTIV